MLEPSANAFEERGVSASNAIGRVQIRGASLVGDDFSVFAGSLANSLVLLVCFAALANVQLGESSGEGGVERVDRVVHRPARKPDGLFASAESDALFARHRSQSVQESVSRAARKPPGGQQARCVFPAELLSPKQLYRDGRRHSNDCEEDAERGK